MSENSLSHKIDVLLGFAHKARKLITGSTATEVSLRRGRLRVLILASDASRSTTQKFARLVARTGVPSFVYGTKNGFGQLLGKGPVGVLGVETPTFAKPLLDFLRRAPEARALEVSTPPKRKSATTRSKSTPKKSAPVKEAEHTDYVPRNPHRRPAHPAARKPRRS